ncbi:MAG: putative ABC transporter permease [Coriobacteriales bacterium]|nr:putative ABC transporter permease [Coriobacteriales bacterium]
MKDNKQVKKKKKKKKRLEPILSSIEKELADGEFNEDAVKNIVATVEKKEDETPLLHREIKQILKTVSEILDKNGNKNIPKWMRVFALIVLIVTALGVLSATVLSVLDFFGFVETGVTSTIAKDNFSISQHSITTVIVSIASLLLTGASVALTIIVCICLFKNQARKTSNFLRISIWCTAANIVCDIMLNGVSYTLITYVFSAALQIALLIYIDPAAFVERKLKRSLQDLDLKTRSKNNKLGVDLSGRGYISLDFFNIFWIFIIGCLIGIIVETPFHYLFIVPGEWQNRSGLLFGQFSPIYGFGALLMTLTLNRFRDANPILIFIACTIIGGVFEYFCHWFLEAAFGIGAWYYPDAFLNINGRTCLAFASMFGLLGLIWIKLILPVFIAVINKIPWKWRYTITTICAVLIIVDGAMTLMAFDCMYTRLSGTPPTTPVELFFNQYFGDDYMHERFQSFTLRPNYGHQ